VYKAYYTIRHCTSDNTLSIAFNSNVLLSSYDSWGVVKNDLKRIEGEFDLTPLIGEMTNRITALECSIEALYKDKLNKAASFILELTKHLFQKDKGEIFVAYNLEQEESSKFLI